MPKVLFRQFRTRKINLSDFRQEVEATIERKTKPELLSEFGKVVDDWQHKPEFRARKVINTKGLTVYVFASGENASIWKYVSLGTRPHPIFPRRARVLKECRRRPGSYKPKTWPRGNYGGPGVATGDVVYRYHVNHPGNAPRDFEGAIGEKYAPIFRRDMENAIRRAIRRIKRGQNGGGNA